MSITIEVAKEAGACFGVERALTLALKTAEQSDGPVHTLGPLIHNPVVVHELETHGVTAVSDPTVPADATLLLRTHGVSPDIESAAKASGAAVIDATCPYVKKVHKAIERLEQAGYQVLIVGEAGHPEVEGTRGHAPSAVVVGSAKEVRELELGRRVGVVVQTTMAEAVLQDVVSELVGRVEETRVINTICTATSERQAAAAELALRSDVMIVIGGKNSANTTHLADICRAACPATHHIETPEELKASWFEDVNLVGVTAGASTPQAHIEAVVSAIERLG